MTMIEEDVHNPSVLPFRSDLSRSPIVRGTNIAGTSTLSSRVVKSSNAISLRDLEITLIVEKKKDKILKLGKRLASDGYNLCLKKIAKAYPKVDTKLLDQIEVSDDESGEVVQPYVGLLQTWQGFLTLPPDLSSVVNDGNFWTVEAPPQHLIDLEAVDSELAGVLVGLEPAAAATSFGMVVVAAGLERDVGAADSKSVAATRLVGAAVESM
ncbi:hypothetical protein F0562_034470 [Nyssa sinensis]|uniref:Uncharacterized protein n=1 Tax=Nyssa sinensis TaxID=561372 RepID=A0A5J5AJN7_9ASTE|nr:hypothetical protein F0562_034470 [Nyssa sinensis]